MTKRILLLDAGNTRLKWAMVDGTQNLTHVPGLGISESAAWLGQGAVFYSDLSSLTLSWQQWGPLTACYGVKVANDSAIAGVELALGETGVEAIWLSASADACGVSSGYRPPSSLGADRWAALIAVRQRTFEPSLVISAGTALTVDALNADGQFLGGFILPGLHMMRQALSHATARVGTQYGKVQHFPDNTADAVESGLIAACTGAIITMRNNLQNACGTAPQLFITGGDAATLVFSLPAGITMISCLVQEGIYYMSLKEQLP